MKELLEQVLASESTKQAWRNDYKSTEWINANKLNKHFFGISLNQSKGCECIEDLFIYIKRKTINNNIMNKFKLQKGKVITSFLHPTITEHSTDAEFIKALKASPATIKFFKEYPENWMDIVNGKEFPTRKEMQSFLTEKGVAFAKNIKEEKLIELWQENQEQVEEQKEEENNVEDELINEEENGEN